MIQSTETLTFEFYTHENMKKNPSSMWDTFSKIEEKFITVLTAKTAQIVKLMISNVVS